MEETVDKMLDDLKTSVTPTGDRPSSRRDDSLLSSFRSTSRSESRNSNRSGIEDGGLMKHHHKEYTSPDKTTRVVTDQFEYETQDPNKFHKKVMKSTYSNYKVSGDISSNLDDLRRGPDPALMEAARTTSEATDSTKVVSASQKVANKLVDALSTIDLLEEEDSQKETVATSVTSGSSTSTHLKKDIEVKDPSKGSEVEKKGDGTNQDSVPFMLLMTHYQSTRYFDDEKKALTEGTSNLLKDSMMKLEEKNIDKEKQEEIKIEKEEQEKKIGKDEQEKQSDEEGEGVVASGSKKDKSVSPPPCSASEDPVHPYSSSSYSSSTAKTSKYGMTNGKTSYDNDLDAEIHEPLGGEVRKIVWRNRFEKTYEGNDGTPSITIEEEARRRNLKQQQYDKTTSNISSYHPQPPPRGPVSPRQLHLQYAVYWPNYSPNISPGGQSWADPIPMPTPPQVSPKGEPGVAYVYTYGQSGSQVQHNPPLNYISMPTGGASVPPSEGAPSPTPSGTQPIIYHYSYHYTLQPGQTIPEGVPQPPSGLTSTQPTLQMAPTPTQNFTGTSVSTKTGSSTSTYNQKRTENFLERNDLISTTTHHHTRDGVPSSPAQPKFPRGSYYDSTEPNKPAPRDDIPRFPSSDEPNRNISITINKTSNHMTHTKEYPGSGPTTSTPFATPGRSRSSSPDRYPRGPGGRTVTHVTHTTNYSDSLDRLRRPPHETLPFPDTSPIKPSENNKIPKRVDDLMTSFSDSEDGPVHRFPDGSRNLNGPRSPLEREPLISTDVNVNSADASLSERKVELKKEETKNVAGPPVYYPPGHHQLFDESMHTMTLKENKRRGMVKWRNEKASGYKESSSSSESKGGMAMVPVCLPLCCGAACAIM